MTREGTIAAVLLNLNLAREELSELGEEGEPTLKMLDKVEAEIETVEEKRKQALKG